MKIQLGSVVTLSYQLYVVEESQSGADQSEVLSIMEERTPENPLDFVYGNGQLLPAVEKAILGQTPGYSRVLRLVAEEAFGVYHKNLAMWLPKDKLPSKVALQVGMKFQTQGPDGDVMAVLLKEISDDKVLLDGNHPLAGATVQFDLRVMRVRPATKEELASGQVQKLYH